MNKVIEKLEQLYLNYAKIGMYSKLHTIKRCIDIIENTDNWISVDDRVKIGDKFKDENGWEVTVVELFLSTKNKTHVGWEDKYEQRIEEIDDFLENWKPINPPNTKTK